MPTDQDIVALDLAGTARDGAVALRAAFPQVSFTSGRRTRASQASAMASNIVSSGDRSWISKTYVQSAVRDACQEWVSGHDDIVSQTDLSNGLLQILEGFTDDECARLSRHLSGMAFDVKVISDADGATAVKDFIAALPGLTKFIESEGGLTIWHAQFA